MKGFWIHLFFYVLVNAGLITLDLSRRAERTWFYWPLGGWGIGIACHAWSVYRRHRHPQTSPATPERSANQAGEQ